ncbi:MAG: hypothetical protein WC285_04530 [Candidatus Gracilibacteria bacterium]|jgi:hypothetical protein
MGLQNKPYGLLSVFAFILAGGVLTYMNAKAGGHMIISSLSNYPGYLVIFFVVIGCALAATSLFAFFANRKK